MAQTGRTEQPTTAIFKTSRVSRWKAQAPYRNTVLLLGLLVCLLGTAAAAAATRNRHGQQAAGSRRRLMFHEDYDFGYPVNATTSPQKWLVLPRISIDRNDIDCGAGTNFTKFGEVVMFCKKCGGTAKVADECALQAYPKCVGFVMEDEDCGYLKAAVLKQARHPSYGETLYCMESEEDCADAQYEFKPRSDIKDVGDYNCNYKDPLSGGDVQQYCFVGGSVNDAAGACEGNEALCKAFVTGERGSRSGAYLKSKTGPETIAADVSLYVRRTPTVPPTQPAVPSPSPAPVIVAPPSPSPLAALSSSSAPTDARIAKPWGACGPLHNARCPGSQCCSSSNYTCGENNFCSIKEGGCLSVWGFCDTQGTENQDGGGKSPWNMSVIAGVASAGAVAVGALLGAMFTAWKWHHKRQALKAKGELPTSAPPSPAAKPGNPVEGHPVAAQPVRPAPHRVVDPN